MSKETIDISNVVLKKIHKGQIKMRPRIYFIFGSIFIFLGLVASSLTTIFIISLMRFMIRSHGPMGQFRFEELLTSFPLWIPLGAVLSLFFGIVLLRQFDFSYKKNFLLLVLGFVLAIIVTGFLLDMTGLDNIWLRRGPMHKMMQSIAPNNNFGGANCRGCCNN